MKTFFWLILISISLSFTLVVAGQPDPEDFADVWAQNMEEMEVMNQMQQEIEDEYNFQEQAIRRNISSLPEVYTPTIIRKEVEKVDLPEDKKNELLTELEEFRKKEAEKSPLRKWFETQLDKYGMVPVGFVIICGLLLIFKKQVRARVREYLGIPKEDKK